MNQNRQRGFSKKWMIVSMIIFITVELILGGFVGQLVLGKFLSMSLRFMLQGLLYLISFFIGGFIIGIISPGVRMMEPAVDAFLSVSIMLLLSIFTPYRFIHFSLPKMLMGGSIAFILALYGAHLGEQFTNRLKQD